MGVTGLRKRRDDVVQHIAGQAAAATARQRALTQVNAAVTVAAADPVAEHARDMGVVLSTDEDAGRLVTARIHSVVVDASVRAAGSIVEHLDCRADRAVVGVPEKAEVVLGNLIAEAVIGRAVEADLGRPANGFEYADPPQLTGIAHE